MSDIRITKEELDRITAALYKNMVKLNKTNAEMKAYGDCVTNFRVMLENMNRLHGDYLA